MSASRANALERGLGLATLAGFATVALGFARDPRTAALSYLVAHAYVFTVALGMLLLLAIGHATHSRWFVLVRRIAESVVGTLPLLALLFVPVLVSLRALYPWLHPATLDVEARHAVEARGSFQTVPWFVVRSIVYLALVSLAGEALLHLSRRQDEDAERATRAMRRLSPVVVSLTALVLTATAFDWFLSLEPGYRSDVFGVYVFAGAFVAALAWLFLATTGARRHGLVPAEFGPRHVHAIGTLVFSFVIFWMYIAFCQFLLGWITDLPFEARTFLRRAHGGWLAYAIAVVVARFALPFALLLSRRTRAGATALAAICAWLALAHYADLHFLLTSAARPRGPTLTGLDVAALVALGGSTSLVALARFRRRAPVPVHDPLYAESLTYGGVP